MPVNKSLSEGADYTRGRYLTTPHQAYKMDSNQDPATVLSFFRKI